MTLTEYFWITKTLHLLITLCNRKRSFEFNINMHLIPKSQFHIKVRKISRSFHFSNCNYRVVYLGGWDSSRNFGQKMTRWRNHVDFSQFILLSARTWRKNNLQIRNITRSPLLYVVDQMVQIQWKMHEWNSMKKYSIYRAKKLCLVAVT